MGFFGRTALKTLWQDKKATIIVVGVILALLFAYYLYFQFKRSWNYNLGYESRVQATVCEMVQPQYLTARGKSICD